MNLPRRRTQRRRRTPRIELKARKARKANHHRDTETQRRASGVRRAPRGGGTARIERRYEPQTTPGGSYLGSIPAVRVGLRCRPSRRTRSRAIALRALRTLRSNGFLRASVPPWCCLLRVLLLLRVFVVFVAFVVAFVRSGSRHDARRRAPALLAIRPRRVRLDRRDDGGAQARLPAGGRPARDGRGRRRRVRRGSGATVARRDAMASLPRR